MPTKSQTVDPLTGDYSAKITEAPDRIFGEFSVVDLYREYLPEMDQHAYLPWLRKTLIENPSYLTSLINNMYDSAFEQSPDMQKYYQENPKDWQKDFNSLKNDIYQQLVRESYRGDDVNSAIQNRQLELINGGHNNLNSSLIKNVIKENPNKYVDQGLITEDGEFNLQDTFLVNRIQQDPDLLGEVLNDIYSSFQQTLSKSHNAGGIDVDNVDEMAQAFVIFKEFGSEGLTQIVNFNQEFDVTKPLEEQSQKAQQAYEFLVSAQKGGKTPFGLVRDFFGGEDTPQGAFTLEKPKASLEMTMDLPREWTPFSHILKYAHNGSTEEGVRFMLENRKLPEEFSWTGLGVSMLSTAANFASYLPKKIDQLTGGTGELSITHPLTILGNLPNYLSDYWRRGMYDYGDGRRSTIVGGYLGMFRQDLGEGTYYTMEPEELVGSVTNGFIDHTTKHFIYDLVDTAVEGKLFTGEDILRQVLLYSHPDNTVGEIGADLSQRKQYRVDVSNLPFEGIMAVEALKHLGGNMVRESGVPNQLIIEPNYHQRLNKTSRVSEIVRNNSYDYVPVYDQNMKIVGAQAVPAKDGFLTNARTRFNRIVAPINNPFTHGVLSHFTELVGKTIYEPMFDVVQSAIERNELQDSMVGRGFFRTQRSYQETIGQFLDIEPRQDSGWDTAAYMGGQMGSYLFTTLAVGNATLSGLGRLKTFKTFSDAHKAESVGQALSVLTPHHGTRLANYAQQLGVTAAQISKNKGVIKGLQNYAKIELGEVVRQPFTPTELSLFQVGQVTDEFGITTGGQELANVYTRSNRIAQIGADMLVNGALGVFLDNLFAMTRFTTNTILQRGGNSWKIRNGEYVRLSKEAYSLETGYSPDMRRLLSNAVDDAQELVMQDISNIVNPWIASYMRTYKATLGAELGDNVKFIDIWSRMFKESADDLFDGLHENIVNTLRNYDEVYGGRIASRQALDERATKIIDQALDYFADELTAIFHEGSGASWGLNFAAGLRRVSPTTEFIHTMKDGKKIFSMSLDEAQSLQNINSFSTIVKNTDGTYSVAKVQPNFWASELASKIEMRHTLKDQVDAFTDYRKSLGLDNLDTNQQSVARMSEAEDEFLSYYGKRVIDPDNTIGYEGTIVGMRRNDVTILTDRGDYKTLAKDRVQNNLADIDRIRAEEAAKKVTESPENAQVLKESVEKTLKTQKQNEKPTVHQSEVEKLKKIAERDETFDVFGVTNDFFESIKNLFDYKRKGKAIFRNIISSIGHNGVLDASKLGGNVGKIEYLDIKKVTQKGGMPKNTVFKMNVNGIDEHFITIKKATPEELKSGLWVKDNTGALTMNPAFRRIEKNQTFENGVPVLYKPTKYKSGDVTHTIWTRAKKGERGYIINVQRPTNDALDPQVVHANNIDALALEYKGMKMYKLVDEHSQVIDPSTFKGSKRDNVATQIVEGRVPTIDDIMEIASRTYLGTEFTRANSVTLPVIGFALDMLFREEDDMLWTKVGLGLMAANTIRKYTGFMGGSFKAGLKDLFDQKLAPQIRAERSMKEANNNVDKVFENKLLRDAPKETLGQQMPKIFGLSDTGVSSLAEALTQNRYFRSMFSLFKRMNIAKADAYYQALKTIDGTIGAIKSNPELRFVRSYFNTEVDKLAKQLQETNPKLSASEAREQAAKQVRIPDDIWERYTQAQPKFQGSARSQLSIGAEQTRAALEEIVGHGQFTDAELQRMFEHSFARVMHLGVRHGDQIGDKIDVKMVADVYNQPGGQVYRELDKRMLQNDEFQMLVSSTRDWFSDVRLRWLGALDDYAERTFDVLRKTSTDKDQSLARMAERFYASRLTARQFEKVLKEQDLQEIVKQYNFSLKDAENWVLREVETYRALRQQGHLWKDIEYMTSVARKFSDLDRKYYPQMRSKDAELLAKKKWLADNMHIHADDLDKAWERHMVSRYIEVNADQEKFRRLKRESYDTDELLDRQFNSYEAAMKEVREILYDLQKAGKVADIDVLMNQTQIIEQPIKSGGKTTKTYIVELPENIAYGEGGPSRQILERYYHAFLKELDVPQSNFLDNPRIAHIPMEFAETNIDRLRSRYSQDTGRRIHAAENRMFNPDEAERYYLNDIMDGLHDQGLHERQINQYRSELKEAHEIAFGNMGNTLRDMNSKHRKGMKYQIYRNFQFMRFGYGFGNYNLFEWAAIGSHLGGGLSRVVGSMAEFTRNPDAAINYESLLRQENIFRRQIQFARPEFQEIGVYDYHMDDFLSKLDYHSAVGANRLGNFSMTGKLLGMFGGDIRRTGALRVLPIFGDSFLGSSMFASSIVSRASLAEVSHLAKISKQLQEMKRANPDQPAIIRSRVGRNYSEPEIERLMGDLGITREHLEAFDVRYDEATVARMFEDLGIPITKQKDFIEGSEIFESIVRQLDNNPNFAAQMQQLKESPLVGKYMDAVVDVVRNATESYNGINKLYRPAAWHSDVGRTLSMYSTYPFNVGLQVTQRRIRQPIDTWFQKYGEDLTRKGKILPAMEVWAKIQGKQWDSLRKMGLSNQAIEEFPTEAMYSTLRVFNSLGISVAGYMSIDGIRDIIAWALSPTTGDEYEPWRRIDRSMTLNPMASDADKITFGDLIDSGIEAEEFRALIVYGLMNTSRLGVTGRWLDVYGNPGLQYYGLAGMAPVLGDLDNLQRIAGNLANANLSYFKEEAPQYLMRQGLQYIPVLGANSFSQYRSDLTNAWLKPKRQRQTSSGVPLI